MGKSDLPDMCSSGQKKTVPIPFAFRLAFKNLEESIYKMPTKR